jgi:L-fuconolactonase
VFAKLSGLNTAAVWSAWSAADLQPYVDWAVQVFGPERLMFGSDWPVATLAGDYQRVWAATTTLLQGLDGTARAWVLGGTAARFYRLEAAPPGASTPLRERGPRP